MEEPLWRRRYTWKNMKIVHKCDVSGWSRWPKAGPMVNSCETLGSIKGKEYFDIDVFSSFSRKTDV